MHSALPTEEIDRESKDNNAILHLVLLDAKAAFDTVIHSHMFRGVFLTDIDDGNWGLIKDLHENAKSVIKWEGNISQPFQVNQGDHFKLTKESDKGIYLVLTYTNSTSINFLICTKQLGWDIE